MEYLVVDFNNFPQKSFSAKVEDIHALTNNGDDVYINWSFVFKANSEERLCMIQTTKRVGRTDNEGKIIKLFRVISGPVAIRDFGDLILKDVKIVIAKNRITMEVKS
jgi:hypothetical protein